MNKLQYILIYLLLGTLLFSCKKEVDHYARYLPIEETKTIVVIKGLNVNMVAGWPFNFGFVSWETYLDGIQVNELHFDTDTIEVGIHHFVAIFKLRNSTYFYYERSFEVIPIQTDFPIEFVTVEGGTFTMGNNQGDADEKPEHEVTLSSFQIGKFEITIQQFCDFMNAIRADGRTYMGEYLYTSKSTNGIFHNGTQFEVKSGEENKPMQAVDPYGAEMFCLWAGVRLPTEAEWEYAARGGQLSQGYKYSGSNRLTDVAWYIDNSNDTLHNVGMKQPNELGIYDMTGNVREWVSDFYSETYYSESPLIDPTGPLTGEATFTRGGCFLESPSECEITDRRTNLQGFYEVGLIGFRVVRNIQ